MRAFIIGENEKALIADLRNRATNAPVDVSTLMARLQDPTEKERHKAQMTAQSIVLPVGYLVTCSVETGHPDGRTCRHISVSIASEDERSQPGCCNRDRQAIRVCHSRAGQLPSVAGGSRRPRQSGQHPAGPRLAAQAGGTRWLMRPLA